MNSKAARYNMNVRCRCPSIWLNVEPYLPLCQLNRFAKEIMGEKGTPIIFLKLPNSSAFCT